MAFIKGFFIVDYISFCELETKYLNFYLFRDSLFYSFKCYVRFANNFKEKWLCINKKKYSKKTIKKLGGTSNHMEYTKVDHTNHYSTPSYMKNKDTEMQNKDTDLDYFSFWYIEGKTGFGDPDGDDNICVIENSKTIFREIEKEWSKKEENEDLLFLITILFQ